MSPEIKDVKISEAKKLVFAKRPDFKKLYNKYENKLWSDYIKDFYPKKTNVAIKSEFFITLKKIIVPLIGKEKTLKTIENIKKTGFVSTAEHMGILCHPYFINGNLLRSNGNKNSIVSFPCGGTSLSNSSFPRGLFFHDFYLNLQKFYLVSLKYKQRPVFGFPAIKKQVMEKIFNNIEHLNIPKNKKDKMSTLFKNILSNKKIWGQKMYSDQLTILNDYIWQETFKTSRGNLCHLECETLVRKIIIDNHINKETHINKIIFNEPVRNEYIKNNDGMIGAHNTKEKTGSHLFWYIDKKNNKRLQLFVRNKNLVSLNSEIVIPVTAKQITKHLESYTLMPTMAFCYGILSSYYGLTLGGGFWQIKYLEEIKNAWQKTFRGENLKTSNINNKIMTADFFVVGVNKKERSAFCGILDIYLWSKDPKEANLNIRKAFKEVSVGKSLNPMMAEFYESIIGEKINIINKTIPHTTFQI